MELTLLLPLLAWLQSLPRPASTAASLQLLPWPVSPAAWPPAPELTGSPQYRVFPPGDSLTLTCSAPSTANVSGICFFKDGQRIDCEELQRSQYNVRSFQLPSVSHAQAGEYSCGYLKTQSGRNISSERSQNIHIAVSVQSKLTLRSPYPILLCGESVNLTCSAPSTVTVSGFRFFRDGQRIGSGELQRSWDGVTTSLLLSSVSESHAGEYSCESWRTESGREIPSERSRAIHIPVTARLPAPQLTVSPQESVYLIGETVTLTCSAVTTPAGIWFFRDNQQIHSQKYSSPQDSVTHSIRLSGEPESQAGSYSCAFWKTESGREIPSERSRTIRIEVTACLHHWGSRDPDVLSCWGAHCVRDPVL